jgi:hypothetical protein
MAACSGGASGWPLGWAGGPAPVVVEPTTTTEREPSAAHLSCEQALADGDWRAAVDACETASGHEGPDASEKVVRAYLGLGRAALGIGDVRSALAWFERAHDRQPRAREVAREYALALAYRGGELALAGGDWGEAAAKFRAVDEGDRLYLAWLPERAPRQRLADVQVRWGRQQLAEGALQEAETLCRSALALVAEVPGAQECLDDIARLRTPTPTPTPTRAPTSAPVRVLPRLPVAPPPSQPLATPGDSMQAPPVARPTPRVLPGIPTLGVLLAP